MVALEDYAYNLRKTINDKKTGAKLAPASKQKMEEAIEQVIEWLDGLQIMDSEDYFFLLSSPSGLIDSGLTVLVTGVTGFIGIHISMALKRRG
ncbi:hypothetical protein SO802_016865 [Lithocarpus litseifolius]|uniref:Uncharacterized protein n=1 Tax=Lithocarpus litseifolius TaxID=425828 RepID=A0AAW2D076_9ROSI